MIRSTAFDVFVFLFAVVLLCSRFITLFQRYGKQTLEPFLPSYAQYGTLKDRIYGYLAVSL